MWKLDWAMKSWTQWIQIYVEADVKHWEWRHLVPILSRTSKSFMKNSCEWSWISEAEKHSRVFSKRIYVILMLEVHFQLLTTYAQNSCLKFLLPPQISVPHIFKVDAIWSIRTGALCRDETYLLRQTFDLYFINCIIFLIINLQCLAYGAAENMHSTTFQFFFMG